MRKRDPNRIEMGRRFREARERLNWSREVLAERADLSVSFIADLELGNTGTRLENFIRLCRLLDLNADYVLFGAPGDAVQRIMDLLRELKEVNDLFASIPETIVVLIAGNHDYVKRESFYRGFDWADNVVMLLSPEPECVEVPEKKTAVYGCSYDKKEILENRLDGVRPEGKMKYHLLLAHGGDARHMPWNPGRMAQAGFDYIACGHIHKPGILIPDKMAYAGALEPTDETQLGPHGYIRGTVDEHGTRIQFVPFARYEYEDLVLNVTEDLTQYALETKLKQELALREDGKIRKIIRLKLVGHRAAELEFSPKRLLDCGRVISVEDKTRPAYDLEQLKKTYGASLISAYIEAFETKTDAQSQKALDYGLEALLAARRNG